jgi:solute carrier family 34 (sodium-dependent phosphate cotransporter)
MTSKEKTMRVLINVAKAIGSLACLYFFVCSLDLLSSAFRLLGGRTTGKLRQMLKKIVKFW